MSEVGVLYSTSKRAAAYGNMRYQNLRREPCKFGVPVKAPRSERMPVVDESKSFTLQPPAGSRNEAFANITNIFTTSKNEVKPMAPTVDSEYKRIWNTTDMFKPQPATVKKALIEGSWRNRNAITSTTPQRTSVRRAGAESKENLGSSNTNISSFPAVSQTKAQFPTSQKPTVEESWRNPSRGPRFRQESNPFTTAAVGTVGSRVLNPTNTFTIPRNEMQSPTSEGNTVTGPSGCRLLRIMGENSSTTTPRIQPRQYPSTSPRRLSPKAKPFAPASPRATSVESESERRKRRIWNQVPEIISRPKGYRPDNTVPIYPQYDSGYDPSKIKTPFTGTPVHINAAWALANMYPAKFYEKGETLETILDIFKGFVYDMQKKPETYQMFLQTVSHIHNQFTEGVAFDICDLIHYLPERIWNTDFAMVHSNLLQVIKCYYQKYPVGP